MSMSPTPPGNADIPSPITNPGARYAAAPAAPYPQVIIHQRSGWSRFVSWLGWTGFLFCGLALMGLLSQFDDYFNTSNGINEKFHSGEKFGQDKIAIISVTGAIMEGDGFVKKQIDRVRDDKRVKGVIVRVDSPGGTVTGSDFIYHHLKKLREEKLKEHGTFPMVVSMGSMAASGGYYVAMAVGDQEKSIYCEPTTTTGSIGVIIPHYDLTGLMEEYKVVDNSIATNPRKQMLSMTKKMSPEDREILQAYIGDSFARFKEIVKDGRPHFKKDEDALNQLATGEIFTATQAKKSGLVDEIGFIEDAIARVTELANLDKEKTRVVKFEQPMSLLGGLGVAQAPKLQLSLETIMEMSAPKAYYLSTSLPPLVSSRQ